MAKADNPTDIIVVHGSRTNEDGSPTEMMKSRIKRAAELYTSLKQQNIDCRVIVTGYQAPDQVIDSCPNVPINFSIIPSFMVSLMVVLYNELNEKAKMTVALFILSSFANIVSGNSDYNNWCLFFCVLFKKVV